jgi:hypothetical protein
MADEVLGDVYEAITIVAIEDYASILQSGESLFWQETPPGINIKPDITMGKDKDHPRILMLVSHTNAESASHHKFWRNIGEFVDARIALGPEVCILNIVFDSGQKRKLAEVSKALFDGFIEGDRAPYGPELLALGERLTKLFGSRSISREERPDFVRTVLKENARFQSCVASFAKDLTELATGSSGAGSGWFSAFQRVQQRRLSPRIPKARQTTLRRGLGRLLPIEDKKQVELLLESVRYGKVVPFELPYYFQQLGLSRVGMVGSVITDMEIRKMTELLELPKLVVLWERSRVLSSSMTQACASILKAQLLGSAHDFICKKCDILINPEYLFKALIENFVDPNNIMEQNIGLDNPEEYGLWLFDYIMTIIKAKTGKQQGYGYTKLGEESGFRFEIAATAGVVLSPFLQRRRMLNEKILKGLCTALSKRLQSIGLEWITTNEGIINDFFLKGLFEDKIYKIAAFDPLFVILENTIEGFERKTRRETFLTYYTGKGAATCDCIKVKNTFIMWQCATDKGVAHKMKELCGRIGMLRVSREQSGSPMPDTAIKKAILLIDGTWTQSQLQRLSDCGFDAIFYPDEMDALLEAIV